MMPTWSKHKGKADPTGMGAWRYLTGETKWQSGQLIRRSVPPKPFLGDPKAVLAAVSAISRDVKYRTFTLSGHELDLDWQKILTDDPAELKRATDIVSLAEKMMFAGLDESIWPARFWNFHLDRGRVEINCMLSTSIIVDGVERAFDPQPNSYSITHFNILGDHINQKYGLADPFNPQRMQLFRARPEIQKKAAAGDENLQAELAEPQIEFLGNEKAVRDLVRMTLNSARGANRQVMECRLGRAARILFGAGLVDNVDELVDEFAAAGWTPSEAWQKSRAAGGKGRKHVTFNVPGREGGRPIKVAGALFSREFTSADKIMGMLAGEIGQRRQDPEYYSADFAEVLKARAAAVRKRYGLYNIDPHKPPYQPAATIAEEQEDALEALAEVAREPEMVCAVKPAGRQSERRVRHFFVIYRDADLPSWILPQIVWASEEKTVIRSRQQDAEPKFIQIRDRGDALEASAVDADAVAVMLQMAKAKEWSTVVVEGGLEFQLLAAREAARIGVVIEAEDPRAQEIYQAELEKISVEQLPDRAREFVYSARRRKMKAVPIPPGEGAAFQMLIAQEAARMKLPIEATDPALHAAWQEKLEEIKNRKSNDNQDEFEFDHSDPYFNEGVTL
ncbi:LPD7 domain-containing protein [Gimibacter soli]|uniref:Large polyvalent protein-associated domain-containing protein n=1 Tax=Gimibacter soli TaxID=3024400 RepID=A0AAE9XQB5_9PROT|nr:LPD7 domain-containing protein [Gimibacter soli]WCL54416.1 hypothetical protein PH603_01415 [Gimibacter soli]